MMKKIIFLLCLMAGIQRTFAQGVPAYTMDTTIIGKVSYPSMIVTPLSSDCYNFAQMIYKKKEFPTMPIQGFITDIFLQNSFPTPVGSTVLELKIRLGITRFNEYEIYKNMINMTNDKLSKMIDSTIKAMDTLLTTVRYDSVYTLKTYLGYNSWWRLPLQQPFYYSMKPLNNDVPQNLVVQLSSKYTDSNYYNYHFFLNSFNYNDSPVYQLLAAEMNNPLIPGIKFSYAPAGTRYTIYIGFNGYSLSVNDPNKMKPFTVFPNPAQSTLHYSEQPSGLFSVYDMSGKQVLQGNTDSNGEIDIKTLPTGAYLLKIGEQTIRFLKE